MSTEHVMQMTQELFLVSLLVALPALVVSLIVGLIVSIFQTVTSIQDQTLSYVPRIILVGLILVITLGFSLQQGIEFARRMIAYAAGGREVTPAVVIYVGLVLARIGAFVGVMPLFGARTPRLVRLGLTIALAAFYIGIVGPGWDPALAKQAGDVHPIVYALAVARESLIGAAMGLAFGLFLLPARVAGEFITHQIGLNVTPEGGAASGESAGVLTNVFEIVAGLVFLIADGHHVVLRSSSRFLRQPASWRCVDPTGWGNGGRIGKCL